VSALPFPTSGGPLWVGLRVPADRPQDVQDDVLIWLRDAEHAERICAERVVDCVILERAGTRATIDYCGAESFAEFVELCQDELTHVQPDFDDPGEEALCKDAVRLLYAATQEGDAR
jgi:hypothetical protein